MHRTRAFAVVMGGVMTMALLVALTSWLRTADHRAPERAGSDRTDVSTSQRVDACGSRGDADRPSLSSMVSPDRAGPADSPATSARLTDLAERGVPWCRSDAERPGFANAVIPEDPAVSAGETELVGGLGGLMLNIDEYSEPVYYSRSDQAQRPVTCTTYGCVGGDRAPVTGEEAVAPGTDGQLVVVDLTRRLTYEFWRVATDPDGTVALDDGGGVVAGSMSVVDLDGRGNRTRDGRPLNITGAGLSRLFGVVRAHEVRAAAEDPRTAIPHALQVALPAHVNCSDGFRPPATKTDGRARAGEPCVEQGARLQLDPSHDCAGAATPMSRAVCFALQRFGAYVADNGSTDRVIVYGQQVDSWPSSARDYEEAGVPHDYSDLDIPAESLRVLSSWDGSVRPGAG